MRRISVIAISILVALLSLPTEEAFAKKPRPPLQVLIIPVRADISPLDIKPGDVVDFKITAVSFIDVQEMRVEVDLTGGAKIITGETSWSGPAAKNEEKTILLTVQAPAKGKGRIKARVSIPPSNGARFAAEAQYVLGSEVKEKADKNEHPVKKDSKGRDILEYR